MCPEDGMTRGARRISTTCECSRIDVQRTTKYLLTMNIKLRSVNRSFESRGARRVAVRATAGIELPPTISKVHCRLHFEFSCFKSF